MSLSRNLLALFEKSKKGNRSAFTQLKALADQSPPNRDALSYLGSCYYFGYAVSRNYEKAFLIYEKAADLGCDIAMYRLGRMFHYGLGGQSDIESAADWYYESAKNDNEFAFAQLKALADQSPPNRDALSYLGSCYYFGYAVSRNYEKAFLIYEKAADLGCDIAMYRLGRKFHYGLGSQSDIENAAYWYYESAKNSSDQSRHFNQAIIQLKKLAKSDPYPYVLNSLGFCFDFGYGVPQNNEKAVALYSDAALQGCDMGMYYLGLAYQYGFGVEKDLSIAMYWFSKSIKRMTKETKKINRSAKQIDEIKKEIQNNQTIKPSNYDDQVVIDLITEGAAFSSNALSRVKKWNVSHAKLCYLMRGGDLLRKSKPCSFPKNSKHLRIYIVGHGWIASNYLYFEGDRRIHFKKLAEVLANYIADQTVTISLISCFGGKGTEENAKDSFGAKLQLALVKQLKRDIPVIARTSYSSVLLDTHQQITFDLNELEKYKDHYEDSIEISQNTLDRNLYKHHQSNSKVLFTLENNRQVKQDAYTGIFSLKKKWKQTALEKLQNLQKTTLVKSKQDFIKNCVHTFQTMSPDEMHQAMKNDLMKAGSPIKEHSSSVLKFISGFFNIPTNTEEKIKDFLDESKSIFNSSRP